MTAPDFDGLEENSADLYADLVGDSQSEAVKTLAVEAVRMWSRLCQLERVISGDGETWMVLEAGRDNALVVKIPGAVAEARQHAAAYRGLVADIRAMTASGDEVEAGPGDVLTGISA